jgi:D-alanyl-D-alanine carboxypeptidase
MKKSITKSSIAILLCALLLFPPFIPCARAAETVSVSAQSAVLYQPDTQSFPLEKKADTPLPMASTTKIMTALTALSLLSPDEIVTVPKEAVGIEGSSAYLQENEALTVEALLYALLLQSANDAATTLAIHACGTEAAFAEEMNRLAKDLGLTQTHFENPHGLPSEGHYTTARELAYIAHAALLDPLIAKIVSTKVYRATTSLRTLTFANHNKLLRLSSDAVGLKTGFTKASGRCLVGAAERDGVLLISVTLNAPSDWQDHMRMWEYGFSLFECKEILSAQEYRKNILVFGGIKPFITATNKESFSAVLPKNATLSLRANVLPFPPLPIREGQVLGDLQIYAGEKEIGRVPLYAAESLSLLTKRKLFQK